MPRLKWLLVAVLAAVGGAAGAETPPPNASYFADCLSSAASGRSYDRDGRYLRFACYGDVAKAFFEALGRRPLDAAYEELSPTVVRRFTEKPVKDKIGLDYCRRSSTESPASEYGCVLTFPAGAFLDH